MPDACARRYNSRVNRLARNTLALYAAQFTVRLFNIIVIVLIGRQLGPADLGRFSFVMATVSFVHLFAVGGLNNWLVREVARTPARTPALLTRALTINLLLATLGTLAVWSATLVPEFNADPLRTLCLRLFIPSVFFSATAETIFAIFDGHQDMRFRAVLVSIRAGSRALICGLLIAGLRNLPSLFAGYLIIELAVVILAGWLTYRRFGKPPLPTGQLDRQVIAELLPFFITSLLLLVDSRVHIWIITAVQGNVAAGQFSAAHGLILAVLLLPGAVTNAAFPQLAQMTDTSRVFFQKLLRWITAAGILAGIGLFLGAGLFLQLFFGDRYLDATPTLRILALTLPAGFINGALLSWLYATHRQTRVLYLTVATTTICVIASWFLVHHLGYVGAAWAALGTELLQLSLFAWACRP